MEREPVHIDEHGTLSFLIIKDDGESYLFEQDTQFIFVTEKDMYGRAKTKRVINADDEKNKELIEIFDLYIKEIKIEDGFN